jgi:glyoxylase-like metal-dependent hydrolase (beta-lactamase superfamily II)
MSQEPYWTDPGAYPVADGIHRIPLPLPMDGLRAVNVYAIETEEGLTLIDGGWAIDEARMQLESSLAAISHKVSDITRFLVTHSHRDHYTQAIAVRREFGSHVSLGIGDRASLRFIRDPDVDVDPNVTQLRRAGAAELAEDWSKEMGGRRRRLDYFDDPDEWLSGDITLSVGTRKIEAVPTPGHTQGHYVFADKAAGLLFAGDHVLPTITPSIGFEPAVAEMPLRDFLASLAKVRAMPDLTLLPAHGAVAPSSHARVDELVAHHEERLDLCLRSVEGGAETAYAVARDLPWTRHARSLKDLDVFNATLATMETLAHVELLAAQGRVIRSESDDEVRYAPVVGEPPPSP